MSWKFLMKKRPAIIRYIETWWRISNIETRPTHFLVLGAVFALWQQQLKPNDLAMMPLWLWGLLIAQIQLQSCNLAISQLLYTCLSCLSLMCFVLIWLVCTPVNTISYEALGDLTALVSQSEYIKKNPCENQLIVKGLQKGHLNHRNNCRSTHV